MESDAPFKLLLDYFREMMKTRPKANKKAVNTSTMIKQDRVPRIPYKLIGNFRVAVFKTPAPPPPF